MKYVIAILALASATPAYATGCLTGEGEYTRLLVGSDPEPFRAIFPTIVSASVPDNSGAFLDIGPADCDAPDVEVRRAKVEAMIGQPVTLLRTTIDYITIGRARQVHHWKTIREVLPSIVFRGAKIGEDAEVLYVREVDFYAADLADRRHKLEAALGKRVYVRLLPQ